MRITVMVASLLFALPIEAAEPQFTDYPAKIIFKTEPAPVDFASSPDGKRFRTRLSSGAASGPNYAGNLTIVSWGCGSNCEVVTIISAESGKIIQSLVTCGAHDYKLESGLLVINPPGPNMTYPRACATEYYEWNNNRLLEIEASTDNRPPVQTAQADNGGH